MLSRRAEGLADSAVVARLQTDLYTALDQSDRAVEVSLEYLRRAGVDWSPHPTNDEVRQEYERIWQQLGNRPIESLVDLPPMTDPACRATLDVLTVVEGAAFFTDQNLRCFVVARMVNLSLEHGNSDGSCVAYVQLGWFVGPRFGDHQAAFRFGKLALDLVEKRGLERFRARVSQIFGYFISPWSRALRSSLELFRRSFTTAQEAGDLKYAVYSWDRRVTFLLATGDPLGDVQREAENGLEFARTTKFAYVVDIIIGQLRFIRTLRGLTPSLSSFNDAEFDEVRFEQYLEADPHLVFATCWYWIRKLQARFYAGNYACALAAAAKAEPLLQKAPGHFEWAEYIFYAALARAAQYDAASSENQVRSRETLAACHKQIVAWAENCPENFGNRAALVAAELARIKGHDLDAMHLYEEAIQSARENGFIQNEAIAHEMAARFYTARGFETIGQTYIRNARYCYLRWGALGKVRQIDQSYPRLSEERTSSSSIATIGTPVAQLDVGTVIKVSQAVSSEIVLDRLIEALMRIAVEHAGAGRGVLIAVRGNELKIEAEARTGPGTIDVALRHGAITLADLPESVLHYVIRTRESVVLNDASVANLFSKDAYLGRRRTRSILCVPIVKQAKLVGVLYLENNLTAGAFTSGRIAVLELLASQAAISLEHAQLYADLQQENLERRRAEDELRRSEASLREAQSELARVIRLTTMGEMAASIAHEVNQPLAGIVTNANASLRWLAGEAPNLDEAREAIRRIVRDGTRAGDVTRRIRALFTKTLAAKERLDINEAIGEVVALAGSEMRRNQVILQMALAADLPPIVGDRVQLQQVVLNLILNGIEAMSTVPDQPRELVIRTQRGENDDEVCVAVQDSGIGLDPSSLEQIFDAFHSTKPGGMGLGLSISRSIVEGHGGRLWAVANDARGATFQFTLSKCP
jgi:signal transduction histidine kinase